MAGSPAEFKARTKQFALRVIRLVQSLPVRSPAEVIGKQLLRSATSVGANYRSACRARSPADFRAKMAIVEEEADESIYWLELLVDAEFVRHDRVADSMREASEIVAMTVASIRSSRGTSG